MVLENIDFVGFISWFEGIGGFDVILPFLLIFAVTFAIFDKVNLLGDKKNIHVVVSVILAFFLVIQRDAVLILQGFLPRVSMIVLSLIMLLLVMGTFGFGFGSSWQGLSVVVAIVGVIWALGASTGWNVPGLDFFTDQDIAILLILGVFVLVIWFVVRDSGDNSNNGDGAFKKFFDNLGRQIGSN
jgi:hypothetical protein